MLRHYQWQANRRLCPTSLVLPRLRLAFESWAPRMMDDKIIKVSPSPENRRQSSREQLRIASKRCSRSLQNSGAGCGVLTRALVQQQVLPGPRWLPTDPLSAPRQLLPFPSAESPWAPLGASASTPFTSLGSRFLSTFFDFPFPAIPFSIQSLLQIFFWYSIRIGISSWIFLTSFWFTSIPAQFWFRFCNCNRDWARDFCFSLG